MKPLGDGFIRLITMIISLIIFCSVVSGIASDRKLFQLDGRRNRKGHEIA
jgi:Na+/H+-dicarboxylate symporter